MRCSSFYASLGSVLRGPENMLGRVCGPLFIHSGAGAYPLERR